MGRGGQNSASDSREEGKGLDRGKERAPLTKTNLEKAPLQNSWAPPCLGNKKMHQGGGKGAGTQRTLGTLPLALGLHGSGGPLPCTLLPPSSPDL